MYTITRFEFLWVFKLRFYKFTTLALLFFSSLAFALDLDGYYITPKVGISESTDTGKMDYTNGGITYSVEDDDLGTATAFGLSAGKYLTDNFRLELELIKRNNYEYNARDLADSDYNYKNSVDATALFINGFYDFQSFAMGSTSITPYLGVGVGISRNKTDDEKEYYQGSPDGIVTKGKTISEFAYKFSAGTLFSVSKNLSVDLNYQYVNLGEFETSKTVYRNGVYNNTLDEGTNGGEIKSHELMVGLQYTFN